jgi:uncharacterized repeat protein (TIGR01451 family)
VISNQGYVSSNQLPTVPTDADGNAANGYQPTTIVVGSSQQVTISKEVFVVSGGAALPGSQLEYTVKVTNTGTTSATNLVITDPLPADTTYFPGSIVVGGVAKTDAADADNAQFSANTVSVSLGNVASPANIVITFRATIN